VPKIKLIKQTKGIR